MRCLKTWTRSSKTQSQWRMNNAVECQVNKNILDRLDITTLATESVKKHNYDSKYLDNFPHSDFH